MKGFLHRSIDMKDRAKFDLVFFLITVFFVALVQQYLSLSFFLNAVLEFPLRKYERVVDYIREGSIVYALTSRYGSSKYGDAFVVYEQEKSNEWERIYENDFTGLKPWKIEAGDIDGDEREEIFIAVRKTSHFDTRERNRLFIFNYDEEKLVKKWTGSQIAGNWNDFYVVDFLSIPGSELIFIEQVEDEKERVCVYYWFDFGFVLLAASESYQDIQDLSILGENCIQITWRMNQKEEKKTLMIQAGKIIEVALQ